MNAGHYRFHLNWSSLWHLWQGWTKLKLDEGISILRLVLILDVSKWQGVINFVVMVKEGVKGVIVKCGQGLIEDPQFSTSWLRAKQAGLPRGTYWYFDSRIEPKVQAERWWNWIRHDPGELMNFVDYEETYLGQWKGWKNLKIFLQEFQKLSGLPSSHIGIYTGYYYWIANSPTNQAELNWFAQFPLWLAWYTTNPANVRIPKPWSTLILWQYGTPPNGEKYGAESLDIDENNYNGDEAMYRERFRLAGGATPPPIGGSMRVIKGKAKGTVRRRNVPAGMEFSPPRYLFVNDEIEASENQQQWLKLSRINGQAVQGEEWVSAGAQQQYIEWHWETIPDPIPDPKPPPQPTPEAPAKLPFTFEAEGYKPFSGELERE